jgi:glutaredoxin-related protein
MCAISKVPIMQDIAGSVKGLKKFLVWRDGSPEAEAGIAKRAILGPGGEQAGEEQG